MQHIEATEKRFVMGLKKLLSNMSRILSK